MLTAFHNEVAGKGKGSLETVATGNPFAARATSPSTDPKEKKRKRRDTASTTQSPHGTPRRPPPSASPIRLETPSPTMPPPTAAAHPLVLLGGDSKFSKGIQVGLTPTEENLLSLVPEDELLLAAIEM